MCIRDRYWYGLNNDPLDETDGTGSTTNSAFNEYVFLNGARTARRNAAGNVFYYFADHLGTSRDIVQAASSTPCYDADFTPYGVEIPYTDTCPQNYKFTGKERDTESNNDDFSFRYYSSYGGRFLSVDPLQLSLIHISRAAALMRRLNHFCDAGVASLLGKDAAFAVGANN